ncbi:MAG: phosphotransferase [Dehalococcoidia bacterium]
MTDAGWEEAELDLLGLLAALEREAAFLAPIGELRVLGLGFYSRVLETESGWIVRVARTADAAYRHAYETRTLPALAPLLGVAIPEPVTALPPSEAAPFGAIAYRSLLGRVMVREETTEGNWQSLAQQLGQEVARLHDASLPREVTGGLHTFDPEDFADLRAQIAAPLRARLMAGEWEKVDAWWEQFRADPTLRTWENVLTHGDIWWGNLLVEGGRISGILDWEFLSVGDAAWDLGTMRQFGDAFYEAVVDEYCQHRQLDSNWRHRADQWWALRTFFGVQFAVEREDEGEWVDSLRKLREGPILG